MSERFDRIEILPKYSKNIWSTDFYNIVQKPYHAEIAFPTNDVDQLIESEIMNLDPSRSHTTCILVQYKSNVQM